MKTLAQSYVQFSLEKTALKYVAEAQKHFCNIWVSLNLFILYEVTFDA